MTDYPIDPYWIPSAANAREAIAEIINRLQNYEISFGLRQRARRRFDQEHFERSVTAIICDVIVRHIANPDDRIRVSLRHGDRAPRSRYEPFSFGQTLRHILEIMQAAEMDFLETEWGGRFREVRDDGEEVRVRRQTTIKPGETLLRWIAEIRLTQADFERLEDEEVIILKAGKEWHGDAGNWIEYNDTGQTDRFRSELQIINPWIEASDISYEGLQNVDTTRRRLRRFFSNERFDHNGRLFGGFWQQLSGFERRRNIRIQGEEVSELDYGQSVLRILYGMVGVEPPREDLYAVPGYVESREGIKLVINSALFSDREQNRMPMGARQYFGRRPKYADVLDAVRRMHAPIAEHLFAGIGMNLMFRESEILVDVLLRARQREIVALPIHDSVLVRQSRAEEMNELMLRTFQDHTGIEGRVVIE